MSGLFMVAKDRVGWYAPRSGRYFELSADGTVTPYPGIPNLNDAVVVSGMALTDSGATLVSADRVYSLDKAAKAWLPAPLPGTAVRADAVIFGGVGNAVATDDRDLKNVLFFEVK
jgi:hypothetical protein